MKSSPSTKHCVNFQENHNCHIHIKLSIHLHQKSAEKPLIFLPRNIKSALFVNLLYFSIHKKFMKQKMEYKWKYIQLNSNGRMLNVWS